MHLYRRRETVTLTLRYMFIPYSAIFSRRKYFADMIFADAMDPISHAHSYVLSEIGDDNLLPL